MTQTGRQINRRTDGCIGGQTDARTHGDTDARTPGQTDRRQREPQKNKQTDIYPSRRTDGQTDTSTEIEDTYRRRKDGQTRMEEGSKAERVKKRTRRRGSGAQCCTMVQRSNHATGIIFLPSFSLSRFSQTLCLFVAYVSFQIISHLRSSRFRSRRRWEDRGTCCAGRPCRVQSSPRREDSPRRSL